MKPFTRKFVSAVLSILALVFLGIASPASAAPSPTGGPTSGGTSVTVQGIRFIEIDSGDNHTLGLTSEGTVYAWGRNDNGQLGNGATTHSFVPVQVKGVGGVGYLTGVTHIGAGVLHSLATTSSGVYAWGDNANGKLGDGTTLDSSTPVQVLGVGGSGNLGPATALAGGYYHSMAITSSGVFSWGSNAWGQLGINSQVSSRTPVQVKGLTASENLSGATAISAGNLFSLALTNTGVYAWGANYKNQLGNNDAGVTTGSFQSLPVKVSNVAGNGDLTGATAISAGGEFGLAVVNSGVVGWGLNSSGQLGNNSLVQQPRPVVVIDSSLNPITGVTSVAAGGRHSLALTPDKIYSWGNASFGELGNRSVATQQTAVNVVKNVSGDPPFTGATMITAGYCTSTAITSPDLYAWGCAGTYGGLGIGTTENKWVPVLSANFRPTGVTFGGVAGTSVSTTGFNTTVVAPAGTTGSANVMGTSNVFGGTTAGSPTTATWNAGTFTYIGAPTISSSAPSATSTSHTFTFTGEGGATFKCSTDNGVTYSTCTSPQALSSLPQGSNTFDVYQEIGGIAGAVSHIAWTVDSVAPTVTFAALSTPQPRGDLTYTATFSEAMTGISASDFGITGSTSCSIGSVTGPGGSIIYTVVVTGCAEGDVVVLRLASGAGTDAAGNSGPTSALSASSVTITSTSSSSSSTPQRLSITGMQMFAGTVALGVLTLLCGLAIIVIRRKRASSRQ